MCILLLLLLLLLLPLLADGVFNAKTFGYAFSVADYTTYTTVICNTAVFEIG